MRLKWLHYSHFTHHRLADQCRTATPVVFPVLSPLFYRLSVAYLSPIYRPRAT